MAEVYMWKKSWFFLPNSFSFSEWTSGSFGAFGGLAFNAYLHFGPVFIFIIKQNFDFIFLGLCRHLHLHYLLLNIVVDLLNRGSEEIDEGADVVVSRGQLLLRGIKMVIEVMVGIFWFGGEFKQQIEAVLLIAIELIEHLPQKIINIMMLINEHREFALTDTPISPFSGL